MSTPLKNAPLRSVSDTALLVAYHRAMETQRPDALFRDEYAVRLSAGRGEQIARHLAWGRRMAWSTIVRAVLFDDVVQRLVQQGVDAVINLAAGLDARPYRLALPATLRWVEVDLPQMVQEKSESLAAEKPVCHLERIPADLAKAEDRRALFGRLGAETRTALIMSEGLLVYLAPEVVGQLADDLHAQPSFRHWALDLASPLVLQRMKRWWGKKMAQANAAMQFAPAEGTAFFAPHGWREVEFHSLFDNAVRLDRKMSMYWMFDLMRRIAPKRAERNLAKWRSGVALLERT